MTAARNTRRAPSLQRRLIVQPLLVNLVTLLLAFIVLLALLVRLDAGGKYTEAPVTEVAAGAVVRGADGGLAVRMTAQLEELRAASPGMWFVARDEAGHTVSFGEVPAQYASVAAALGEISYADIRGRSEPYHLSAVVRREKGPAGALTVIGHGKVTGLTFVVLMASNVIVLPIMVVFALVSLINTPWIVRRALTGLNRIAQDAERINPDHRGLRLPENEAPREIAPLVRAVNDALARLDEGYERQRRFIASAAHELRTPIAILRAKIDAAPEGSAQQLSGDVARLATLAEQLLDLQRLDHEAPADRIDLGALVREVAADLAPLLIAGGAAIEVDVEGSQAVTGSRGALERVVTNLVQNATGHGGRQVVLRVRGSGFEVQDDGPGIPAEERERVFEPFHRLRPRSTGAGLGLSLVRHVVERHGGAVAILDAPGGGTLVRVTLPAG